ncbi:MAG TPA: PQQ-binding-like beta-propeller repeat protein, partial [Ktedonobacterales bacterium]|nr:PQQ-binding-like beta-propeller repeat protein [Ktedonobacterales bacterium]
GRRQVCALRAADGTTRWCTELGALPNFYKVVADPTGVYVLSQEERALEAEIVALSPADGAIQWQRAIQIASGGEAADTYGALDANAFTVQNGLLYLVTTDSNRAYRLVTLRASDGTTRWELATDKPQTTLIRGDVAYVANESVSPMAISLQALQASTGKLLWKRSIDTPSQLLSQVSEMVADGEMLYVLDHERDHLYAIEAGDGQMRWERTRHPCYATGVTPLPEPHSENGVTVWCSWDTDRVSNSYGVSAPDAMPFLLAAGT